MIETSVRILKPGMQLALPVRRVRVQGTTNTPELREKVCYRLRLDAKLIAVPCQDAKGMLIVVTDQPFTTRQITVDGWKLELSDTGEGSRLDLHTREGRLLLPQLVERMMTDAISRVGAWWSFDSLNHWYENEPFKTRDGIDAYRRFELSVLFIEDEGLGVSIDVGTAFFTQDNLAGFFDPRVPPQEQARRRERFESLTRRQKGQHGTLLYDNGVTQNKCYFEGMAEGKTCGATRPRKVRGREYRSLVDYYRAINPKLNVPAQMPVAMVSFSGLEGVQPVAAHCLQVRVMNDELPASLAQDDKIAPQERRPLLEAFWQRLGHLSFPQIQSLETPVALEDKAVVAISPYIFPENGRRAITGATKHRQVGQAMAIDAGQTAPGDARQGVLALLEEDFSLENQVVQENASDVGCFSAGFWRPKANKIRTLPFPTLFFGKGQILPPPPEATSGAYKAHFQQRMRLLEEAGAYHFPPLMERILVGAYPENEDLCHATDQLMETLCDKLQRLTKRPFEYQLSSYMTLDQAIEGLNEEKQPTTTVFVLNEEPEAYAEVAHGLPKWKVKRLTNVLLRRKYRDLTHGSRIAGNGTTDKKRGQRSWDSFLRMTTLDVLQVLEGVPYRLDKAGEFEAQLVIDVSHDRRYYALSLLIAREQSNQPHFRLVSYVVRKPDNKETINGRMLKDDLIAFLSRFITAGKDTPLASLLIGRDGRIVGDEYDFLVQAVRELVQCGCLNIEARVEIAELHKETQISLRMWDVDEQGTVTNVLEGTTVRLSATQALLATTGAGTLRQGTAEPMLIVVPEGSSAIESVTEALGAAAHLNWSSPEVAQRLPMPFKRTDEVLKARSEQEIRRIR